MRAATALTSGHAYFASAGQPRTLGATLRYDFF